MSEVISDETSKRMCSHMNADHAASVHGMVLNSIQRGAHISDCKMVSISMEGCELSYVACGGNLCELKTVFMKFSPPLGSVKESRSRLIAMHHQALAPKIEWLVIDPFALGILIITVLLAYGTYGFGGAEGLATVIQSAKRLNDTICSIWGSADMFAAQVVFFWYFAIIAHLLEALYVAYHAIRTLKLRLGNTLMWFYLVLCVGFPVARRLLEFTKVHVASKASGDKKKH